MNSVKIVKEVLTNGKSLAFLSRSFGAKYFAVYIKNVDGTLQKVHGKSASTACKELAFTNGVVRSYGKAVLTTGDKSKKTFMTEYRFMPELLNK